MKAKLEPRREGTIVCTALGTYIVRNGKLEPFKP